MRETTEAWDAMQRNYAAVLRERDEANRRIGSLRGEIKATVEEVRIAERERDEARAERDAARDAEAEARHDIEAVQAHCNLTQSELDDLAVMLGVQRDAPYGEVKAALAAVLAGDVNRLRDLADQIEQTIGKTPERGHDADAE